MKVDVDKYLEASTIHGLAYISRKFHAVERIFWLLSLLTSAICTIIVITQLSLKLSSSPIVVYLSDKPVPVSEIFFPAITVCPNFRAFLPGKYLQYPSRGIYRYEKHTLKAVQYSESEYAERTRDESRLNLIYKDILEKLEAGSLNPKSLGMRILKRLQLIDLVTKRGTFEKLNYSVPTDDFLDVYNEFFNEFAATPPKQPGNIQFSWISDINQFFPEVLTPYGLCVTFNLAFFNDTLNANETGDDFHYKLTYSIGPEIYNGYVTEPTILPRKISTSHNGLNVNVRIPSSYPRDIQSDIYDGFVVMIHDPFELPSEKTRIFRSRNDMTISVAILPEVSSIEKSLVGYQPKDRNCYLEDERKLKFFKKYTRNNCLSECLSDYIIENCGCVEFFMIRNTTTRICSGHERKCFETAHGKFNDLEESCECLQPCTLVKYEYETESKGRIDTFESQGYSILDASFRYRQNSFNELVKKQQFNIIDFFCYVGGFLGLFAGFSILSFFELVYWFGIKVLLRKCKRTPTRVVPFNENERSQLRCLKIRNFIKHFFEESSIHGFLYISQGGWIDRILWIIFITLSIAGSVFLISLTEEKVPESRIIAYDDNLKNFNDIPFPAVTFTINPTALGRGITRLLVLAESEDFTDLEKQAVEFFDTCTAQYYGDYEATNFAVMPKYETFLKRVMNNDRWIFEQESKVNEKFQPVFAETKTARGLGYTFNLMEAHEIFNVEFVTKHFLFTKNITTRNSQNFPEITGNFTFKRGTRSFLDIKLKEFKEEHEDYLCAPVSLLIHPIDHYPSFSDYNNFFTISYGENVKVEVTPEITTTSNELKALSPETRECYFDGERKLEFFAKYSQQNCIIECMANYTWDYCACFDWSHPIDYGINYTCNFHNDLVDCMKMMKAELYSMEDSFQPERNCSCLQNCNSVTYKMSYFLEPATEIDEININVHVNTENVILYRRYQQFTSSDVFSYVGGLFGLFAGISMLSIIEIAYFLIVRVTVDTYRTIRGES